MKKINKQKDLGIGVDTPKTACDDEHCPFHKHNRLRGRIFKGLVKKTKSAKTATVEWTRLLYIKKYERYEKRKTRLQVHNPPCISALEGDNVTIMECKPISKTKKFVIIKK